MDSKKLIEMLVDFKANGIRNAGKGLEKVIAFQDIIGRSAFPEIREVWKTLDQHQRSLFLWSCSCCLSFESMDSIIMETLGKDAKMKMRKELEDDYAALEMRESEFSIRMREFDDVKKRADSILNAQKRILAIINELEKQS